MGVRMNLHSQSNPSAVTGNGSETVFLLGNNADLDHLGTPLIYLDGVLKATPGDYSISGYAVTFTSAVPAGVNPTGDYSTLDRQ